MRRKATTHLRSVDPLMNRLIAEVGTCRLEVNDSLSPFQTLLRAIIYQKLATASAAAIYARVQDLCSKPMAIEPAELLALDGDVLRAAGLSKAKLAAVIDLAEKTIADEVPSLAEMRTLDDADIIERLTAVKGIGRWTVEMMLIYRLGRTDVLPVGDFAIRKGYQLAYQENESPTPAQLASIGRVWAPYRTVASWYLWRATDTVDWSRLTHIVEDNED